MSHTPRTSLPARARGMTLIDVVVGSAVMLVVFLGIFGAFQLSIELVFSTKAKTGAVALMTERLEYIRSLPYASVGTAGGIPAGPLLQLEQETLNGVQYTVRTLIQYEDAPEDGLDDNDENGITADYKTVKVEVLWSVKGSSRSTSAVTRVAPLGEESLDGGGSLRVSVFDAAAQPIPGATVRVVNTTTDPGIDVSVTTNANGRASFPGAPQASEYEITVSKPGYSTAQTYAVTLQNPNPSPNHVSVVEGKTSAVGLAIDRVGTIRLYSFEPRGPGAFADTFADMERIFSSDGVGAFSGALTLLDTGEGYGAEGNALSDFVTPSFLTTWEEVSFVSSVPEGTALRVRVYYQDGADVVLVPEVGLPGNAAGFTTSPISLASLSPTTYRTLQLGAEFETVDPSVTPELLEWRVSYTAGPTPRPNVDVLLRGAKTIGTDASGQPVYKFDVSETTTQFAEWFFETIEWDTYTLSVPDTSPFVIYERCPNVLALSPNSTLDVSLTAAEKTPHTLRVVVEANGAPLPDATITVSGPASHNGTSSSCGQAFFGNLTSGVYTLSVSQSGFQPYTENIGIAGQSEIVVSLTPL